MPKWKPIAGPPPPRAGKVVLLDTTARGGGGPAIGFHFGMTGRLVIDGVAAIGELAYGSTRDLPEWERGRLSLGRGRSIVFVDPRRLGRMSLDPVLRLGPDALSLTTAQLAAAIGRRTAAVKTVLMDQHAVAGLGNMCVDEVLFWAGLSPHRPADSLDRAELRRLARVVRTRMAAMLAAGGSHTGTIDPDVRRTCPPCPRDGAPLRREPIGGRTSIWCPRHQR